MSPTRWTRAVILAVLLGAPATVGGCGSGGPVAPSVTAALTPTPAATATSAPTPAATPTATPAATPTPAPSPTSAPPVDAAADLAIAAPYTLEPLDAVSAAEFDAGMKTALGNMASLVEVGVRSVANSGKPVAGTVVLVIDIPNAVITSQPGYLDSVAGGIAGTSGGTIKPTTIAGQHVELVVGKSVVFAGYKSGTAVVFAISPSSTTSKAVVAALLKVSH